MLEYAKGALVSKTPWKGWQYKDELEDTNYTKVWIDCDYHPAWDDEIEYRRKPRTILINGYEVPEPLRVAPENGKYVYVVDLTATANWRAIRFEENNTGHIRLLNKGMLHVIRDAVLLHAKALLSFTTTVQEKQDEEV